MKVWSRIPLLLLVPLTVHAQVQKMQDRHAVHALHDDQKAYIAALEDPNRESYQKPNEVLDALAIKPGETLADIGSGSGYFTLRLSNAAGVSGKVYAVDVSQDMIDYLKQRIRERGANNVIPVLAAPDDPRLADASIDRIFICDTWHHIDNHRHYLELLKKALRPGGQIIMIDFQKRELPVGPPLEMKIAREDLIRQMESSGFSLAQEHSFLPYQYFLVFLLR